jgi:hypothetical protein
VPKFSACVEPCHGFLVHVVQKVQAQALGSSTAVTKAIKPHKHACATRNSLVYIAQATGFQRGGGVTMVVDYSGPDTGGRKIRCPSVEAVEPQPIKASEWTMQMFASNYELYVSLHSCDVVSSASSMRLHLALMAQSHFFAYAYMCV